MLRLFWKQYIPRHVHARHARQSAVIATSYCTSKPPNDHSNDGLSTPMPPVPAHSFSPEKWSWVPPRKFAPAVGTEQTDDDMIPVKVGYVLFNPKINNFSRKRLRLISHSLILCERLYPHAPYREYLTTSEISEALEKQGGENIKVLVLLEKLDNSITEFLIVSGRSTSHLKKMAQSIVTAVRLQKLRNTILKFLLTD